MPCDKPCNACKPGDLPILFTRYSVGFSAEPNRVAVISKLTPQGAFRPPAVPLATATGYTVRMLREGVLYVLIERAGDRKWFGYMVHPHGYLTGFDPRLTPEPEAPASPACEVLIRGANKSLVWVADPAHVTNLWYFFSPDTILPDVLKKLKDDPSKLHCLDVAAWANAPEPQPHTCMPDDMPKQVGEWAALADTIALEALNEQIYGVMGLTVAEQGYGAGQIPLYVNASHKTTTAPPPKDIFSADNPLGTWRKTERLAPGTLASYAEVHGPRLANIVKTLAGGPGNPKRAGIVAACDDPIGIAQELSHWRNKAYRDLIQWGDVVENTPEANRQSRKTRFEVANTWAMMAPLFRQKRLAIAVRNIAFGQGVSDRPLILEEMTEAQRRAPHQGRIFDTRAAYDAYMDKLRGQTEVLTGPVIEARWEAYKSAVDLEAMDTTRTNYAAKAEAFETLAAQRAPDALAWIDSPQLQAALALYNGAGRDHTVQGAKFAAQINGILEGFGGGGEACEKKLMAWAQNFADNPKNLLWRGYLMNQVEAQATFDTAMRGASAPGKTAPQYVELFKVQLDKFAKFNDLMAGPHAGLIRISQAVPLFGMSAVLNNLLHTILKAGSGRLAPENALARSLMASVAMGTGSAGAFELYVGQQAALKGITPAQLLANKNYSVAQAQGKLRQTSEGAVNRVIAQGGGGAFFKLRLTGALTILESVLFMHKAKELKRAGDVDATRRAALEFAAASLTTTAAALEVGAVIQEWLITKSASPGAVAMAEVRLGGFKLAGSALAGVAGVVGAYLDFQDGSKASAERKYALAGFLYARSFANGLAVGTGVALGLSYAGPLLEHLAETTGSKFIGAAARAAGRLAARRAWLFAATWYVTLTVLALTFVIGLLSDDEMQKWVKRSSFRKLTQPEEGTPTTPASPPPKPAPLYDKPGEELTALYGAFAGVAS